MALIRGAFEYQGQKCSAASRAYVAAVGLGADARRLPRRGRALIRWATSPTCRNFMGAVIDDRAFAKHSEAIARAKRSTTLDVLAGGTDDDSVGYFVRPTVVECERPDRRDVHDRVLRADPRRSTSTTTPTSSAVVDADGVVRPVRADRGRSSRRTGRRSPRARRRCGSRRATSTSTTSRPARSSASSRSVGARSGTNDKAGSALEPAALDVAALDQGDVRAADRLPLPAHGLTRRPRARGTTGLAQHRRQPGAGRPAWLGARAAHWMAPAPAIGGSSILPAEERELRP